MDKPASPPAILHCDSSTPYFQVYLDITQSLRCPVCEGQRIASSDSPFAQRVKRDVCTYLHQGMSEQDIIQRIDHEYGGGLRTGEDWQAELLPAYGVLAILFIFGLFALKKLLKGKDQKTP